MEGQIFEWPRLIGGPLHGEPIPETTDRTLIGYAQEPSGNVGYYHETKFRLSETIAIRVLIFEGSKIERHNQIMHDVAIHALASVGIVAQ